MLHRAMECVDSHVFYDKLLHNQKTESPHWYSSRRVCSADCSKMEDLPLLKHTFNVWGYLITKAIVYYSPAKGSKWQPRNLGLSIILKGHEAPVVNIL